MDAQVSELLERVFDTLRQLEAESWDSRESEASTWGIQRLQEAIEAKSAEAVRDLANALFYHNGSPYYESSDLRAELNPLRTELKHGLYALHELMEASRQKLSKAGKANRRHKR